ncbi:hypothetical protein DSO57_1016017 [Entomophthora muscae]|uniref:Uncharacterized protein n=1 Tax=Entomophthora muscae TaxID=34485 RepID=A0ACC2TG32_9FUNG|nr:hypothetical protein DSO57_1016017 [Entomophthora muscae]
MAFALNSSSRPSLRVASRLLIFSETQVFGGSLMSCRHKKKLPTLKVELLQTVPNLGFVGDTVLVKPGRMRNTLYPLKMAKYIIRDPVQLSRTTIDELQKKQEQHQKLQNLFGKKISTSKSALTGYMKLAKIHKELRGVKTIKFIRAALPSNPGEPAALFGSVTVEDVVRKLQELYNVTMDKEGIKMERIKKTGTYTIALDFSTLGSQDVTLTVEAENQEELTTKQE